MEANDLFKRGLRFPAHNVTITLDGSMPYLYRPVFIVGYGLIGYYCIGYHSWVIGVSQIGDMI